MRNDFPLYTTDYISGVMSLRKPQKESLKILEEIVNSVQLRKGMNLKAALGAVHAMYPICSDFEREFLSLTFALATGVGKTRLMGAFIAYLYIFALPASLLCGIALIGKQGGPLNRGPPCCALDDEFADTVEKRDTQFLVQIFIKCTVKPGFFDEQRFIECEERLLCGFVAALGLDQQILKIHNNSSHNSFRSFFTTR